MANSDCKLRLVTIFARLSERFSQLNEYIEKEDNRKVIESVTMNPVWLNYMYVPPPPRENIPDNPAASSSQRNINKNGGDMFVDVVFGRVVEPNDKIQAPPQWIEGDIKVKGVMKRWVMKYDYNYTALDNLLPPPQNDGDLVYQDPETKTKYRRDHLDSISPAVVREMKEKNIKNDFIRIKLNSLPCNSTLLLMFFQYFIMKILMLHTKDDLEREDIHQAHFDVARKVDMLATLFGGLDTVNLFDEGQRDVIDAIYDDIQKLPPAYKSLGKIMATNYTDQETTRGKEVSSGQVGNEQNIGLFQMTTPTESAQPEIVVQP